MSEVQKYEVNARNGGETGARACQNKLITDTRKTKISLYRASNYIILSILSTAQLLYKAAK